MQTLIDLLGDVPDCARDAVYEQDAYLMREGEPADAFFVITHGAVALETYVPQRGPVVLQTLGTGELLGWSWLVPPYRTHFDARALNTTQVVEYDGACLRGRCESDPAFGYDLLKLFVPVIVSRLQQARLQMLDVYGRLVRS